MSMTKKAFDLFVRHAEEQGVLVSSGYCSSTWRLPTGSVVRIEREFSMLADKASSYTFESGGRRVRAECS